MFVPIGWTILIKKADTEMISIRNTALANEGLSRSLPEPKIGLQGISRTNA
jgi:hypothetical protein